MLTEVHRIRCVLPLFSPFGTVSGSITGKNIAVAIVLPHPDRQSSHLALAAQSGLRLDNLLFFGSALHNHKGLQFLWPFWLSARSSLLGTPLDRTCKVLEFAL